MNFLRNKSLPIAIIAVLYLPQCLATMWNHNRCMTASCSRGSSLIDNHLSRIAGSRHHYTNLNPMNLMAEIFSVPITFNTLLRQQHRHFSEMQHLEPRYEVFNDEKQFQVTLDLPGVQAEDIVLELKEDGSLQIIASRNTRQHGQTSSYAFTQSISLDKSVIDVENITAKLSQGVLTISAPKLDESKRQKLVRKIPVMTKGVEETKSILSSTQPSQFENDEQEEEHTKQVDGEVTNTINDEGLEITEEDI